MTDGKKTWRAWPRQISLSAAKYISVAMCATSRAKSPRVKKGRHTVTSDKKIMAHSTCIVGAGVSGLRCATVLLGHAYDVTIIEARNRVGGRVRDISSASDSTWGDVLADCPERSDGIVGG